MSRSRTSGARARYGAGMQGMGMRAGRDAGFSVIYLMAALAVAAGIATAVTVMTPSGTMTGVQENRFGQAYYAAYSGLQYLKYAENGAYGDIDLFIATINSGSPFSFVPDSAVSVSISKIDSAHYKVEYIVGVSKSNTANESPENFLLALDDAMGRRQFTPLQPHVSPSTAPIETVNFSSQFLNLNTSGEIVGDIFGDTIVLNGGSTVKGSITSASTSGSLVLVGHSLGDSGESICSNSGIDINGNVSIYGTLYSRGDVNVNNGRVQGDIYAGGDVVINSNSVVDGNINAIGSVVINNGSVTKTVYSGGSVTLGPVKGGGVGRVSEDVNAQAGISINNGSVAGIAHYKTSFYAKPYNSSYGGKDTNPIAPKSEFNCKFDYTLPSHEVKAPNQTPANKVVGWTAPTYDGKYTIVALPSISDYYSFSGLSSPGGTKVCFDLSSGGYINIFVSGEVNFQGDIYVKTKTGGDCFNSSNLVKNLDPAKYDYASKVYMDVSGPGPVQFGGATDWFGTIFSGNGINFGTGSTLVGTFYTSSGNIANAGGSKSTYVQSDYVATFWK